MDTMEPRAHFAKSGVAMEAIAKAVVDAARENGWRAELQSPGAVLAELSTQAGKHRVTVVIDFDLTTFVVRYQSSHNLGYTEKYCRSSAPGTRFRTQKCVGPGIHPYYNQWLLELQNNIARRIAMLKPGEPGMPSQPAAQGSSARSVETTPPPLIADEIRKLKELRDEGALSDAEYEQQKQKLLAE